MMSNALSKENLIDELTSLTPVRGEAESPSAEEPGGQVEDSVHLYLRDIGHVPLLTFQQEQALAKGLENGRFLASAKERLTESLGRDPSPVEVTRFLLEGIGQGLALARGAEDWLPLPEAATLSDRLGAPQVRRVLDGRLDEEVAEGLGHRLGLPKEEVQQALVALSVASRIVPPRALAIADGGKYLPGWAEAPCPSAS